MIWYVLEYFVQRKIFSSIWMYSEKYFEKYFQVFNCILENTMENQWWRRSPKTNGSRGQKLMVVEINGHLQWQRPEETGGDEDWSPKVVVAGDWQWRQWLPIEDWEHYWEVVVRWLTVVGGGSVDEFWMKWKMFYQIWKCKPISTISVIIFWKTKNWFLLD